MNFDNLLDFASRTATAAGEITLRHFGRTVLERKADGSEVTIADREAEEYLVAAIADAFPQDGVFAEEGGSAVSRSGRRWIIDPIDGTRSYASGVPLYGVLLALEIDGVVVLGCCHLPALGETVVGAVGAGAWHNGERCTVSDVDRMQEARVVTSGLEYWRDWGTPAGQGGWSRLVTGARYVRTWGDCYGYVLVATGRAEIHADIAVGALWDFAPMIPIMAEARGRFTTLENATVFPWRTALASNGRLHDLAIRCWDPGLPLQIPAIVQKQGER